MAKVKVFVRYHEINEEGRRTGNILYESDFSGDPAIVRRGLQQLEEEATLQDHEAEYTIRGKLDQMPAPVEEWWKHLEEADPPATD